MTSSSNVPPSSLSEVCRREFAATWQWRIDTDPELAASLGLLSRRRSKHALDPRSIESFEQRLAWVDRALRRIRAACRDSSRNETLTPNERLSLTLYVQQLEDYAAYARKHKSYLCCVNRLEGPQTDLALYARYLPVKTRKDREFYREFLRAIPVQLREVRTLLERGLSEGITPPRASLSGVVEQIRAMIEGGLESFANPLRSFPNDSLKEECEALLVTATDSFGEFADFLQDTYISNLRTEISASRGYPNGEEYYRDCLRFHTTTSMTPEAIHELGLTEVRRVRTSMEKIADGEGYKGRLQDYLEHLRTASEFEPTSPSALLSRYRDIVGRLYPALLDLFHLRSLPRQPLAITETPGAAASMAPAAYYLAGSTDSDAPRPGIFYVNTSNLSTRRTYECEALALHEAIPGHHIQAAIQAECADLPDFRKHAEDRRYFEAPCRFPFYTGYIEGWGLHSETLGTELGLYKHPTDEFGQLSMEAIRCCRLVVDTGMHALGWSQERAVQYMLENTAMGEHDARTEVARYITWPGQATAYKVGERQIRKLRDFAEVSLGEGFDVRGFYDAVLLCGAVPLDVLEARVKEYVASSKPTTTTEMKQPSPQSDTSSSDVQTMSDIMTFANWCKCCVVPGACQV